MTREIPCEICTLPLAKQLSNAYACVLQFLGLDQQLSDPEAELTVFAPTNDAFAQLVPQLGLASDSELFADAYRYAPSLSFTAHPMQLAPCPLAIIDSFLVAPLSST